MGMRLINVVDIVDSLRDRLKELEMQSSREEVVEERKGSSERSGIPRRMKVASVHAGSS